MFFIPNAYCLVLFHEVISLLPCHRREPGAFLPSDSLQMTRVNSPAAVHRAAFCLVLSFFFAMGNVPPLPISQR